MDASRRTARWTGVAYLALAAFGAVGFLIVRPLAVTDSGWASLGVALELGTVTTQAAAAVGFFALFRHDRPVAAFAIAGFGLANAVAILGSAAMLTTIVALGDDAAMTGGADAAPLLRLIADAFWTVGGVFFGLWLMPMGWFILATGRMPRVLGGILIIGGAGYLVSAVLTAALPGSAPVADMLSLPATAGELWMVGYLLSVGIRSAAPTEAATPASASATS